MLLIVALHLTRLPKKKEQRDSVYIQTHFEPEILPSLAFSHRLGTQRPSIIRGTNTQNSSSDTESATKFPSHDPPSKPTRARLCSDKTTFRR